MTVLFSCHSAPLATAMTQPSDVLQYRHLVDRLVLDSQTMVEVGRVDTLWMYPQRNRVLGVVCRPGRFGAKRLVFKLTQMDAAGGDSLLMQGDPEPTVAAKVQQLESLIGQEVWSDRGERVGKIVDCLFKPDNGVILRYLITPGTWASVTDGIYLLSPKQIVSFSAKRTLIAADDIDALEIYQPGLRQRLAQIRDMLKEDYVDSVARELRSLSSQVQGQMQGMAERAQGQMETLLQRTRERAQAFSEEFSQDAQEVMRTIQTEAQSVTERVEQAGEKFGFQSDGARADGARADADNGDLEDWGVWPDIDGDGAEAERASWIEGAEGAKPERPEPERPEPDTSAADDAGRSGPIIVPAAKVDISPPDADAAPENAAAEDSSPAIAFDDSFEGWPESEPSPELTLETDERDIWDDWGDDAVESLPDDAAAPDAPVSGDGASPDIPSAPPSTDSNTDNNTGSNDTGSNDDDPWI